MQLAHPTPHLVLPVSKNKRTIHLLVEKGKHRGIVQYRYKLLLLHPIQSHPKLFYARATASIDKMPAAYEIRAGGDVKNKKQSMADLKLRRLNELNSRLREDLERPRIKVSEASMS